MRRLIMIVVLIAGMLANANNVTISTKIKELNVLELSKLINDAEFLKAYKFKTSEELKQIEFEKARKKSLDEVWKGKLNDYFKALAVKESGNDHKIYNKYGYIGLWQLGRSALITIGYGHITFENFKKDPTIFGKHDQYKAIVKYTRINKSILQKYIDKYVGTTIDGILITESGILAGAHIGGARGVQKLLDANGVYNPKDANGTSILDYINEFANYEMETI